MNTEVAKYDPPKPALLRPVAKPAELIEAHKELTQIITQALEKGRDYGLVPGTQKETLFKPGAERLLKAFGCHAEYILDTQEIDHDREVKWTKRRYNKYQRRYEEENGVSLGLYRYVVRCIIRTSLGISVGTGIGSCSTLEAKYVDRPRDLENTVLKMAQKRALVAAVLNAFGLSDRFTQDMDDHAHDDTRADGAPDKTDKQTGDQEKADNTGYDAQNKKHQDILMGKLRKKGVPEDRWDDVGNALNGRPASDLDKVLKEVL